jgi:hypothetical protein
MHFANMSSNLELVASESMALIQYITITVAVPRMSVAKPNLTMVSSVTLAKSSGQHYRATGSL